MRDEDKGDDLPIIPKLPDDWTDNWPIGNRPVAKCGECGREIYQIDMYVCSNRKCPVQAVTWC